MSNNPKIEYFPDGNIFYEIYYVNGELHREDGPAFIRYFNNGNIWYESYYINGKLHRENGRAYIEYDEDGDILHKQHYINGCHLNKDEWYSRLSKESKIKLIYGLNDE